MIPYLRKEEILSILKKNQIVKIAQICKLLPDVSESTIRRDLKEMNNENRIEFLSGGAVMLVRENFDMPVSKKIELNNDKKDIIADLALKTINDNDTVFIDSGTTCTFFARKLENKPISIVTTNADLFSIPFKQATVIFTGGTYNPITSSLHGITTQNFLKQFYFSKSYLGTSGIDYTRGLTTPSIDEAETKKVVISNSENVYILADSSKFGKVFSNVIQPAANCAIITDRYDEQIAERIKIISSM